MTQRGDETSSSQELAFPRKRAEKIRKEGGRAVSGSALAIRVDRPDGTSVRIGPIPHQRTAESMYHHFTTESPRSRDGAADCTVAIVPYDETAEHLPLLPACQDAILELLDDPVAGVDAPFPDLWDRLHAQHGSEVAAKVWSGALRFRDALLSPEGGS